MINYVEVHQTPLEQAINTYEFLVADLSEGLEYSISTETYNKHMQTINSNKRITENTTSRKFCEDFYREYNKGYLK